MDGRRVSRMKEQAAEEEEEECLAVGMVEYDLYIHMEMIFYTEVAKSG